MDEFSMTFDVLKHGHIRVLYTRVDEEPDSELYHKIRSYVYSFILRHIDDTPKDTAYLFCLNVIGLRYPYRLYDWHHLPDQTVKPPLEIGEAGNFVRNVIRQNVNKEVSTLTYQSVFDPDMEIDVLQVNEGKRTFA